MIMIMIIVIVMIIIPTNNSQWNRDGVEVTVSLEYSILGSDDVLLGDDSYVVVDGDLADDGLAVVNDEQADISKWISSISCQREVKVKRQSPLPKPHPTKHPLRRNHRPLIIPHWRLHHLPLLLIKHPSLPRIIHRQHLTTHLIKCL